MSETVDFWEGFTSALNIMDKELDKFFSTGYNAKDNRARDSILDLKIKIKDLREMNPNDEETLAMGLH